MGRRQKLYQFGNAYLSIYDLLKKDNVLEYLTRNDETPPLRHTVQMRLWRGLRDGSINQQVVNYYIAGRVVPERRTGFVIGGRSYTAKQALNKFPQLVGFLQPKKKIKSLENKFRVWFKKGKIPDHIFNEQPPEFVLVNGALGGAFQEYKMEDDRINRHGISSLFDYLKERIITLINQHPNTKLNLTVYATTFQPSSGDTELKALRTGSIEFLAGTDPEVIFNTFREVIYERLAKSEDAVGSGWLLKSIDYVIIKFAEYKVSIGSSYKPLPVEVKNRQAILNMKNNDNECFKWAITRALNPVKRDGERVTKMLRKQAEEFDWMGVKFPTSFRDIDVFENLNKVSVKVLGWNEETHKIDHIRLPQVKYTKTATLFLHDEHYSVVVNMRRLTRKDMSDNKYYFCPYCQYKHKSKENVNVHQESCAVNELTQIIMPKEGECVEFKNHEYTLRKPYAIYADFECRFEKVDNKIGNNTTQTNKHIPIGYCYRVVSDIDADENKTYQYKALTNEEDVSLHFVKSVYKTVKELGEKHSVAKPMVITSEQQQEFFNAEECWVCHNEFDGYTEELRKVRDHCHFTGLYIVVQRTTNAIFD